MTANIVDRPITYNNDHNIILFSFLRRHNYNSNPNPYIMNGMSRSFREPSPNRLHHKVEVDNRAGARPMIKPRPHFDISIEPSIA